MVAQIIQLSPARTAQVQPMQSLSERDADRLEGLWNSVNILETTLAACRAKIAEINQHACQRQC